MKQMDELMTGVEILNVTVVDNRIPLFILGCLALIIAFAVCGFIVEAFRCREYLFVFIGFFLAVVSFGAGIFAFVGSNDFPKTFYKVTIDDNVSMSEFLDRYKIVEVEGKIYEIVERVSVE